MITKTVKAELFIKEFSTGGSHPSLIECCDGNNYVVKHSQLGTKYHQLINEYIAAHLAKLAKVNIPDFAFVDLVDEVFPNDVTYECGRPIGLGFGSKFLSNTSQHFNFLFASNSDRLSKITSHKLIKDFISICAFDVWLMNSDRSENNTNLLLHELPSDIRLVAIDHASVFYGLTYSLLKKEIDQIPSVGDTLIFSAFFSEIYYNAGLLFDEFKNKALAEINNLSNDKISSVIADIPTNWNISSSDKSNLYNFIIFRKNKIHNLFNSTLINAGY